MIDGTMGPLIGINGLSIEKETKIFWSWSTLNGTLGPFKNFHTTVEALGNSFSNYLDYLYELDRKAQNFVVYVIAEMLLSVLI